jgi:hypothetical protein
VEVLDLVGLTVVIVVLSLLSEGVAFDEEAVDLVEYVVPCSSSLEEVFVIELFELVADLDFAIDFSVVVVV